MNCMSLVHELLVSCMNMPASAKTKAQRQEDPRVSNLQPGTIDDTLRTFAPLSVGSPTCETLRVVKPMKMHKTIELINVIQSAEVNRTMRSKAWKCKVGS